jgi:hypothetical protein
MPTYKNSKRFYFESLCFKWSSCDEELKKLGCTYDGKLWNIPKAMSSDNISRLMNMTTQTDKKTLYVKFVKEYDEFSQPTKWYSHNKSLDMARKYSNLLDLSLQ